jgi:hypothetical protein
MKVRLSYGSLPEGFKDTLNGILLQIIQISGDIF